MTTLKDQPWFIALLAIIAGILLGIWFGYQILPRFQSGVFHNLSVDQQDDYVILVALGYQETHDLNAAMDRLARLNAPNKTLLVSSVLGRAAKQSRSEQELAALAQLDMALGASKAVVERYLPTATPTPPTLIPTATATPKPLPTATPVEIVNTPTPTVTPTHTSTPTITPTPQPVAIASDAINVRGGPGTIYPVIGSMQQDEEALIIAKNKTGDWWQVKLSDDRTGWVSDNVVTIQGDVSPVSVATNIPTPPPTSTPAATPTPTAPAVDYVVKSIRLWGPEENGGEMAGGSLHCGGRRQLHAFVLDVNGQALNGVTILGIYSHVEQVSGSAGPGEAAWVLGDGDGLRVVRDVDGSAVVSETADGMVTDPVRISDEDFIAAGYCTDHTSCQALRDGNACHGHYSWDVTFQRTH